MLEDSSVCSSSHVGQRIVVWEVDKYVSVLVWPPALAFVWWQPPSANALHVLPHV